MEYKVFRVFRGFYPNYVEHEFYIEVVDGVIVAVKEHAPTKEVIDLTDFIIAPGFVDVHIHGFEGFEVSRDGVEGIYGMSERLPKTGVVAFLPTFVAIDYAELLKKLKDIDLHSNFKGAIPLGVHLEGAFLNPKRKGAMDEKYFLEPSIELAKELIKFSNVRMFTVAPELPRAFELIRFLSSIGISISLGHTEATYDEMLTAYLNGATSITHLFNAMAPFSHRAISSVGASLYLDFYLQFIADTHHTQKEVLKLLRPYSDRLVLITDAIEATNLDEGIYNLGEFEVIVRNGIATLKDGTLAGSVLTMDKGVRNLISFGNFSFEEAIKSATLNPALSINEKMFGAIKVGYSASFVCLNDRFEVEKTIVKGEIVYEK